MKTSIHFCSHLPLCLLHVCHHHNHHTHNHHQNQNHHHHDHHRRHHHDHHHHHDLANMQSAHLLARSGLTHPEVSSMLSPGSFCLLVCSFFIILCHPLQGILFACCIQFLLYSCVLSKTGVVFSSFAIFVYLFYDVPKCILLFFSYI
jgi:hypothetical protein